MKTLIPLYVVFLAALLFWPIRYVVYYIDPPIQLVAEGTLTNIGNNAKPYEHQYDRNVHRAELKTVNGTKYFNLISFYNIAADENSPYQELMFKPIFQKDRTTFIYKISPPLSLYKKRYIGTHQEIKQDVYKNTYRDYNKPKAITSGACFVLLLIAACVFLKGINKNNFADRANYFVLLGLIILITCGCLNLIISL